MVILASAERAARLCARPAWIAGFEHRIDSASLGARDLTAAPSAAMAGRAAGGAGVTGIKATLTGGGSASDWYFVSQLSTQ